MIGRSISALIFIRACIFGLQSVVPISIIYTLLRFSLLSRSYHLPLPIEIWFNAETVFYVCFYLPRKHHVLQKPAVYPPPVGPSKRQDLFLKCNTLIKNPERYISKWFRNAPLSSIRRGNLIDFLHWAFLNGSEPPTHEEEEELQRYVTATEEILQRQLDPGRNEKVKPLRLTLEEVRMSRRSLMWYGMVSFVDILSWTLMRYYGFGLFPTAGWFNVFPGRPHALLSRSRSPAYDLSYWYRPHKSKTKHPIVFFHGIGIGVYPYIPFLSEVVAADPDIGIVVVEYMPISMRICHHALASSEFCRQVSQILTRHRIHKFVLIAHSYGTFQATHLLHSPHISTQIDSLILIDPVSLLLHLPEVAYNFTSRTPKTANEFQLQYFAARDPGIAHTLYRRFFWTENILWKEELEAVRRCGIVMGGKDLLFDSAGVWEYLTGRKLSENGSIVEREEVGAATVLYYKECDHGQVFDTRARRELVVALIGEAVERVDG